MRSQEKEPIEGGHSISSLRGLFIYFLFSIWFCFYSFIFVYDASLRGNGENRGVRVMGQRSFREATAMHA